MAYTALDPTLPDWVPQTGIQVTQSTRDNVRALRDALVAAGAIQGFNYSVTGGTASQPATLLFKRGVEWIKVNLTWGTTGGEDGNVTKAAYYYSSDSGSNYFGMADAAGYYVQTIAYDSSANVTTTTWGATP